MKIYKKILLILFFTLFLLSSFNINSSFASSVYTFINGNNETIEFTVPENAVNFVLYREEWGEYVLCYTTSTTDVFAVYTETWLGTTYMDLKAYSDDTYSTSVNYYRIGYTTTSNTDFASQSAKVMSNYSSFKPDCCIYSTMDLYNIDDKSNPILFFQVAPPEEAPEIPETEKQETLTTTIPALETVEQIPTAMVETLKLIIPVGLVIFGIVLLILLIKSVILRMT